MLPAKAARFQKNPLIYAVFSLTLHQLFLRILATQHLFINSLLFEALLSHLNKYNQLSAILIMAEPSQNFRNTSGMIPSGPMGRSQAVLLSKLLVFLRKQRKEQCRYQVIQWSYREGQSYHQWPRVGPRCNPFRSWRNCLCSWLLWSSPCPRRRSSLRISWSTNRDGHVFEFLILPFGGRFDDDHLREDDVLANANLREVPSQDDALLEDSMITYFNVIRTLDQALLADQVLRSGLVELFLFVAHLLLEEVYHSFGLLFADSYLAHWTICNRTHLCYYKTTRQPTRIAFDHALYFYLLVVILKPLDYF